ncbi:MAG: hypothetical protein P8N76_18215 [Pirellulaceae bacterium]|nr:hypothetical protein [Pirellulaceae bacterium]
MARLHQQILRLFLLLLIFGPITFGCGKGDYEARLRQRAAELKSQPAAKSDDEDGENEDADDRRNEDDEYEDDEYEDDEYEDDEYEDDESEDDESEDDESEDDNPFEGEDEK